MNGSRIARTPGPKSALQYPGLLVRPARPLHACRGTPGASRRGRPRRRRHRHPLREAILNMLPEFVIKRNAIIISPEEERSAEVSPLLLLPLADRRGAETGIALGGVRFSNDNVPGQQE